MRRPHHTRVHRWPVRVAGALYALLLALVLVSALASAAEAEQASQPGEPAAARLDLGANHSCAVLDAGPLRCWGFGDEGRLGYGNTSTIGDDETPGSVGPVSLGMGHTATAISAGDFHTCALLEDGTVRCWGLGADGRLGYQSQANVTDPASAGAVALGGKATAISAGGGHTCALLEDGNVRCWGFGGNGQLGYGDIASIGDTETPDKAGPVKLGGKAIAISAGGYHTCALLETGKVRCWGDGERGELGYGSTSNVGDKATTTPDTVGPVDLGPNYKATAITAGQYHTCALLDNASVYCWGFGVYGRLGYGNEFSIGDDPNETPSTAGAVKLGGHGAQAISAGNAHTCARLDDSSVRCWGQGVEGQLGYANTNDIGDNETPDAVGSVSLGRSAVAISAGAGHTCARLDDASVRCWGNGGAGQLGYCNRTSIGDDEAPATAGPVDIGAPSGGAACPPPTSPGPASGSAAPTTATGAVPSTATKTVASDAVRARGLRSCLATVAAHAQREKRRARHGSARQRARARRHLGGHARSARRRCLRLFGRTPGRVTGLQARARGKTKIELDFKAVGTDGNHPPAARSYVVKQSLRPIRGARGFARAQTLCKGPCRFTVTRVGGRVSLAVTDLRPHTTYYYAVAARDNVSGHRGPRSPFVKAKTR